MNNTALEAATATLRRAERNRAKCNRRRDLVAAACLEGLPSASVEVVGLAALAAARAQIEVNTARAEVMRLIDSAARLSAL